MRDCSSSHRSRFASFLPGLSLPLASRRGASLYLRCTHAGSHLVAPRTTYSRSVTITTVCQPYPYHSRKSSAAITARSLARLEVCLCMSPHGPFCSSGIAILPVISGIEMV